MSTLISRTKSLGRRLAIALLSLALLLQGQAVSAMSCHDTLETTIGAGDTVFVAGGHHDSHAHENAYEQHHQNVDLESDLQPDPQACVVCAGCCAMTYVSCSDARDAQPHFKSPSPSISTGDPGSGNVPEGPRRPPR